MASIENSKLRIDMTPMVDLGFLLISFFIFTTTMSSPRATALVMPTDGEPSPMKASHTVSILMGPDKKVWYYEGIWSSTSCIPTSLDVKSGVGELIQQKQRKMGSDRDSLLLQIQPLRTCSYEMVIDAMDQALINDVKRYVVTDASPDQERVFGM